LEQPQSCVVVAANDASVEPSLMAVVEARSIAAMLRPDRVHLMSADQTATMLSVIPRLKFGRCHPSTWAAQLPLDFSFGLSLTKFSQMSYDTDGLATHGGFLSP